MDAYIFICYIFFFSSIIANVTHLNCIFRAGGTPTPQYGDCFLKFNLNAQQLKVTLHFLVNNHKQPEISVGLLRKFRWIFPSAFILCQATAMTIFLLR
jgi:hypothetical protein